MPTSSEQHIMELVTGPLRLYVGPDGRLTAHSISSIQEAIMTRCEKGEWNSLRLYLVDLKKRYDIDIGRAIVYVQMLSARSNSNSSPHMIKLDTDIMDALRDRMKENRKQLIYLDEINLQYDEIKEMAKGVINQMFRESEEEIPENRFVFPFIVSKNCEVYGEVMLKTDEHPKSVALVSLEYSLDRTGRPTLYTRMFGEKSFKKNTVDFTEAFHLYSFIFIALKQPHF